MRQDLNVSSFCALPFSCFVTNSFFAASIHTDFDEYPEIHGINNARDAYRLVSEEEKEKIAQQVETFRNEKNKFDKEVAKWDDTGNDIIVIAKQMCMIMMEMTDFTRGKGPLKTTMDVINAAKKISESGTKLDKFAGQIADQCPESSTKKDLIAYLQMINLYCHQLNITSKVKADVQNISGNLIVSGVSWHLFFVGYFYNIFKLLFLQLDSATSLIQAAKNLMNAVVLTVKSSYVASTKYPRINGQQNVCRCNFKLPYFTSLFPFFHQFPMFVWKMKAPEKKPLVRRERPDETRAKVRRGSQKRHIAPIKALSEFHSDNGRV